MGGATMSTDHYDNAKFDAEYANTSIGNAQDDPAEALRMGIMLLGSICMRLGAIADALTEGRTDE